MTPTEYINVTDIKEQKHTLGIIFNNDTNQYEVGFDVIFAEGYENWIKEGCPSYFTGAWSGSNWKGYNLTSYIEFAKCKYTNQGFRVLTLQETHQKLINRLAVMQVNLNSRWSARHCVRVSSN